MSREENKKEQETCPICYTNPVGTILNCGFETCKDCLMNWVLARITFQATEGDEICRCLSNDCNHMMTKLELIMNLDNNRFQKINEKILGCYLSNANDIRKCPNQKCNFAGIIKMRPCSQKLQCDKCDFEWQDPSQVISYNPLSWINPNREKQYFSYLAELFQGKPCPICKTIIFKAAGCDHMTCSKCGGDFCWLCLNIMDGPRHPQDTMCPSHRGWTTLFIICSIFSLYFHLSYRFKSVNYYGGYVLYWIAVVASLIICGLIVLICFDLISRWYRFGTNKCQAYFSMAVLPTMIAGFVLLVIYTRFGYHMALTLGIGVISACVLACVAGIVAFLVDRLTRRNYQRFVDEVELDEVNRGNQDLENQNNQHVVNRDEEEVVREDVGNRQNRPPSRNRSSERRKSRSSRRVGTERNSFEGKRKSRRKSTNRKKKSKSKKSKTRKSKSKKTRTRGKRLRE